MMMMERKSTRDEGKKEKNGKKEPRRQKQPNGNAIRRRAPKRRRTILQRLAEKNVIYPERCFGYQRKAALDQEVRRAMTMEPAAEANVGLSGRQLAHMELMMRSDGTWGLTMVLSSALQIISCIASDVADLAQVVAMDLDCDHHMEEIAPLPDNTAAAAEETETAPSADVCTVHEGEESQQGEQDEEPEDMRGSGVASSSGRPPRRRRAQMQHHRHDQQNARGRKTKRSAVDAEENVCPPPPEMAAKTKRHIESAPWRRKRARLRYHPRDPVPNAATRTSASSWQGAEVDEGTMEEDEDGIPCEEEEIEIEDEDFEAEQEEYGIEEDDNERPEAEGEEHDETNMMQETKEGILNGVQLGVLSAAEAQRFIGEFKAWYPTSTSTVVDKAIIRALMRGVRSKLPGIRKISRVMVAHVSSMKIAEAHAPPPTWWKKFWARVRTAVKKAGKLQLMVEDDDEVELMQYLGRIPEFATYHASDKYWVARMLQKELEMYQEMGKGIGAKIRQLLNAMIQMEEMAPESVRELTGMLRSVLISFQEDEIDEASPDEVDEWTHVWTQRLKQWMDLEMARANDVVEIQDSADQSVQEAERAESVFVEMVVGLQKRMMALAFELEKIRLKRSAAMAQNWDDWALQSSMNQVQSPKRQRTIGTQVDAGMIMEDINTAPSPVEDRPKPECGGEQQAPLPGQGDSANLGMNIGATGGCSMALSMHTGHNQPCHVQQIDGGLAGDNLSLDGENVMDYENGVLEGGDTSLGPVENAVMNGVAGETVLDE